MRAPLAALAAVALAGAALACGARAADPDAPDPEVEAPGDEDALIAFAPGGADLVLELDIARLRESEALSELVAAIRAGSLEGRTGVDLLAADELVLAAYHIGEDAAQALTFVRGKGAGEIEGAKMLREKTAVLGPPELSELAVETAEGARASLASDERIHELRKAAIPSGAPGAALRVGGSLGFDARVGLSRLFSLAEVPVAISIWGDVVDDLALVALLGAESAEEAESLAEFARSFRDRAASIPQIARYALAPALRAAQVEVEGATVKVTVVVPPTRLDRAARALAGEILALPEEEL